MRLAIMQPYVFPYIGYFQLINCVDKFIILDDVSFIKKGWINKNRVLSTKFTIPLEKISQNKLIKDTNLHSSYPRWLSKFIKTLEHTYKKAPYYPSAFELINDTLDSCEAGDSVSKLALNSIKHVLDYLSIQVDIIPSSSIYNNQHLRAQTKILDICSQENASKYFNLSGGKKLYSPDEFKKKNIELLFVSSNPISYSQFNENHEAWLSIIDILMFNDIDTIRQMLYDCTIEGKVDIKDETRLEGFCKH
jgi:hypothetical protein